MSLPSNAKTLDDRREPRYTVSWRARIELPGQPPADARVRDISEHGVGLQSDYNPGSLTTLNVTLGVPDLADSMRIFAVPGTLRLSFVIMQGHDFRLGGVWAKIDPAAQELLHHWVRRLRVG